MAFVAVSGMMRNVLASPGGTVSLPNEPVRADGTSGDPGTAADVSGKTGAFEYSYPIVVPPSNRGVTPSLALSYSSRGPVYGGLASGWKVAGVPDISVDTSRGLSAEDYGSQTTLPYVSELANGERLVQVQEESRPEFLTFRAQNDPTYARYELMQLRNMQMTWRVRTLDGITYYFGQTSHYQGDLAGWQISPRTRAPLTEVVDSFGNKTSYFYLDGKLDRIEYAVNTAAGISKPHATIELAYEPPTVCEGRNAGSSLSYRTGRPEEVDQGKLRFIRTRALDANGSALRLVRQIELQYDQNAEACDAPHGPQRQLASIQETAYSPKGVATVQPATTFTYGPRGRAMSSTLQLDLPSSTPDAPPAALVWGRRYWEESRWATVHSMLVDLDGDGYQDRAYITNNLKVCEMGWDRGTSNGFVATGAKIPLPTLSWGMGGPSSSAEDCSLTAQRVLIRHDVHPSCPNSSSYLAYRFIDIDGDGQVELVAALSYDPHGLRPANAFELGLPQPSCQPEVHDSSGFLDGPPCKGGLMPLRAPCDDNMYVWYVYDNLGGTFSQTPEVMMSPIPLAANTGDTAMGAGRLAFLNQDYGLSDLNGDGLVDAFTREANFGGADNPDPDEWRVWFGTGDGFEGPHFWAVRNNTVLRQLVGNLTNPETLERRRAMAEFTALYDVNGDGLPDLVDIYPEYQGEVLEALADVYYNTGMGFSTEGDILYHDNLYTISTALIDYMGSPYVTFIENGKRWSSSGPVDIDGDGRLDWYWPVGVEVEARVEHPDDGDEAPGSTSPTDKEAQPVATTAPATTTFSKKKKPIGGSGSFDPGGVFDPGDPNPDPADPGDEEGSATVLYGREIQVAFNAGGHLSDPTAIPEPIRKGLTETVRFESDHWFVRRRFTDVTGDGLPDAVEANDDGTLEVVTDGADEAPLRLLRTVDNGRGQVTHIRYAPHTDPSVVTQKPSTGRATAQHVWVVASMQVTDAFGPTLVAEYHYTYPVVERDWLRRFGFRGFEAVSKRSSGRGVTVERFAYDLDPTGRKVQTLRYLGNAAAAPWYNHPNQLRSVAETRWQKLSLFGGQVASYAPDLEAKWSCKPNDTSTGVWGTNGPPNYDAHVADCKQDKLVATFARQWSPYPAGGSGARFYAVPFEHRLRRPAEEGFVTPPLPGEVTVWAEYQFLVDATRYRLVKKSHRVFDLSTWSDASRSVTVWDPMLRAELSNSELVTNENGVETWATTTYGYDMATGMRTSRTKPQQLAEGGALAETYDYDPFWLYVAKTANELGHVELRKFDYGTGASLRQVDANGAVLERTVDGLGRTTEEARSHDDTVNPAWTMRRSYDDLRYQTKSAPVEVVEDQRISFDADGHTRKRTEHDGAGRISRITIVSLDGTGDAVTTYGYANSGDLATVTVPNPQGLGTSSYQWVHDALGRLVSTRRPDGTGQNISYSGLEKTYLDYVPSPDPNEPLGELTETRDSFGRLLGVLEKTSTGSASTLYAYDGNGVLSRVDHADGRQVILDNDMAGRRTATQVGTTRWSYTYDLNGNLLSKTAPHPSATDADAYTTEYEYDALDRVTSEVPPSAGLSDDELDLLMVGPREYWYDTAIHGVGRLARITLPWGSVEYDYDLRGLQAMERQSFDLSNALGTSLSDVREVRRNYNALEQVVEVMSPTGQASPGLSGSVFRYGVNARGLPDDLWWSVGGDNEVLVSHVDYNLSGAPDHWSNAGGTQSFDIGYDANGQVASELLAVGGTETFADDIDYYGTGDVRSVGSAREGGTARTIAYKYDPQHQVVHATGSAGYEATYGYNPAGRLTAAIVVPPSTPSDVRARDVAYLYEDPRHPEAVTSLASQDGRPSISYQYDDAGNVTSRDEGNGNVWSFTYDGSNLQRIVREPDGSAEVYYYLTPSERTLAIELDASGAPRQVTFWVDDTELVYDAFGNLERGRVHASLGGRNVVRVEDDQSLEFTYHNRLGHLIGAVSEDGDVRSSFVLGPFGELVDRAGDVGEYPQQLNGKWYDDSSGLSYYGYRYYDRLSQTWTQADPLLRYAPEVGLGQPRRLNLYSYTLNNPLSYVDPDGRDTNAPRQLQYVIPLGGGMLHINVPNTNQGIMSNRYMTEKWTTQNCEGTFVTPDGNRSYHLNLVVETKLTGKDGWRAVGDSRYGFTKVSKHRTIVSGGIGGDTMNMGVAHERTEKRSDVYQTYVAPGQMRVSLNTSKGPMEIFSIGSAQHPLPILVDKKEGEENRPSEHRFGAAVGISQGTDPESPDFFAVKIGGESQIWRPE